MSHGPRAHLAERIPPDLHAFARRQALSLRAAVAGGPLGRHRARHTGHGVDFFDHRAYSPGDDPRRLDWRAIGRRDRPVVRRTEAERAVTLTLLLDAGGAMAYGTPARKFDAAVAMALALAIIAVRGADRFSAWAGCDGAVRPLVPRPRGTMAAVSELAEACAGLSPAGTCPWRPLLDAAGRTRGPGTHVVAVLSDLLDAGAGAPDPVAEEHAIVERLRHLAHRRGVLVLRTLHADEQTFPFDDDFVRFVDLRGVHPDVEADPAALRAAYLAARAEHDAWLHEALRPHGIALVEAEVPGSLVPPVRRALAALAGAPAAARPVTRIR